MNKLLIALLCIVSINCQSASAKQNEKSLEDTYASFQVNDSGDERKKACIENYTSIPKSVKTEPSKNNEVIRMDTPSPPILLSMWGCRSWAVVEYYVDEDGSATEIEIVSKYPKNQKFRNILRSLRRARFETSRDNNGKPIRSSLQKITFKYEFD